MWFPIIVVFCLISSHINCDTSNHVEFSLEPELFVDVSWTIARPTASRNRTVLLTAGRQIVIPFCLRTDTAVGVKQVLYSNDGPKDMLAVKFDGQVVTKGETLSRHGGGNLWSIINSLDLFGNKVVLTRGRHIMTVLPLSTDLYGVEIDRIVLAVDDELITEDMFSCDVYCLPSIPDHTTQPNGDIPSANIIQKSTESSNCTESQNIVVDFYHPNVKKFRVTAQHPSYRSLLNIRKANLQNCEVMKPLVWEFNNLSLSGDLEETTISDGNGAEMHLNRVENTGSTCFYLDVAFNITAKLDDIVSSDLGGALLLNIAGHESVVSVIARFTSQNGTLYATHKMLPATEKSFAIDIPDRTWSRENDLVRLSVCDGGPNLRIESWKLTRRELKSDISKKVVDNVEFVAEAVFHDMWWMGDRGMNISVEGTSQVLFGHFLRIYTRVPWGGYSQTFVIYDDGVIRLLPPTIHGADWIPFGTSLLTGRFEPKDPKASSRIRSIQVHPKELKLTVTFEDGSVWLYQLSYGLEKTQIEIEIVSEGQGIELSSRPFLQLRSMFIKDGRSNVDRLSVNGLQEHRIMDKWSSLYGTSFFFYRGCSSDYHTQAPDINVELLG